VVHALGFEPINEEQFEIFHEVDALYNKKRWPKRRRKRATSHQKRTVNRISRGG